MLPLLVTGLILIIAIEIGLIGVLLELSNRGTRERIAELDKKMGKIIKEGEKKC